MKHLICVFLFTFIFSVNIYAQESTEFSHKPIEDGTSITTSIEINHTRNRIIQFPDSSKKEAKDMRQQVRSNNKWKINILSTDGEHIKKLRTQFEKTDIHIKKTVNGETKERNPDVPINKEAPYVLEKKDGTIHISHKGNDEIPQRIKGDLKRILKHRFQGNPLGKLLDGKTASPGDKLDVNSDLIQYLLQSGARSISPYLKEKHLKESFLTFKKTTEKEGVKKAVFQAEAKFSYEFDTGKSGSGNITGTIEVAPETCRILSKNITVTHNFTFDRRDRKSGTLTETEEEMNIKTDHETKQ